MSNQSDTLAQAHRAVAVVGVGAIMPDALDAFTFWQNIQNGRYSITEVPPDRWNADDYYDPDPSVPDKTYSKIGGWVRDFIFEPYKWRMPIPPKVLEVMDDGQKWAIATCRAALLDYGYRAGEDAGRPLDTERTAVILGNAMAGENHYMTALRIHFPDYVRALRAVPQFDELPPNMQDALLSGMRAGIHNRIPDITEDTMPGELSNIIAGRVANLLDLGGPNFVTDAACASSLAALHAAVEGLIAGHFDAVLTGGIDRNMGPSSFVKFSKIGALSPDGSRPYAEGANGFVMGEGAAVFLLKRLADAERDGDAIYAVIRGIGAASDGKGKGITAPNPIGPRRAIERAWRNAGLSPDTVGYMEGHGTSTRVGDIVEVESMERVLREFDLAHGSIPLGSVKSNLGHLKGAAGAAGLLKAIYALRDKVLPPTVNFERPNPNIDFEHSPFYVHTELRPWDLNGHNRPPDRVRRAGVSSFGFGGTNFHVVLEEHVPGMLTSSRATFAAAGTLRHPTGHRNGLVGAEGTGPADRVPASPGSMRPADAGPGGGLRFAPKAPYRGILVLGASTISGLQARLKVAISDAHAGNAPQPRAPFVTDMTAAERIAIDFGDADELAKRGEKATRALETDIAPVWMPLASQGIYRGRGKPGKVAFLFPGQGSQYVNMLRELYDLDPIVAQTFQEADEVMTPLLGQPLTSYVFVDGPDSGPPDKETLAAAEDKLRDTTITQPAVLTVNVALTRLLASYGITPDIVIGHSLGEYGALVAAGVLPFAQALEVVSARGREMSKVSMEDNGYMAAIFAPIPEVERILASIKGYVVLANINSPSQAVIGGTTPAVDRAIEAFTKADYRAVKIPVSHAFHTEIVAPASEPLKRIIGRMDVHAPRVPLVANVTGDLYPEDRDEIVDLLGRQVASPVQFVKGIETLYREGARILVEVGPKRVLTALAGDILSDREDITTLFTNHPRKGALPSLNEALCGLYAAGVGTAQPKAPIPPERSITKGISLVEPVQTPETHTSFPPATADHTESTTSASARAPERVALRQAQGAAARQTPDAIRPPMPTPPPVVQRHPQSDVEGNDDRYAALGRLFADFMDQGRRIYDGLPPSGGAPEVGARAIPSDGRLPLTGSVVVTGTALGLPGQERRVFDEQNVDRILRGEQFIDLIPYRFRQQMAEKRITRLVKRESGATFELISDPSETIKLAGRAGPFDLAAEFGVPESRIEALDKATQLAMAAGIDALRDAGIPLVLRYRTTSQNTYLPDRWMLPEAMADETGVIFCSAFPGLNRMADEVTRYQQYRALNEQHKTLTQLRMMAEGQDGLLAEIDRRILQIEDELSRLDYGFDRRFIFRVLAMGHSQFAEHIGARGPNTHVNAACATTTHAVSIAEDWMRTGRCRRVIIIAGDDVTSEELMEWIGSGLLATGATTTEERLDRAALPFDQRRHGTIIGMGAAAIVLETEDAVRERGMRGTCEVLSSQTANSAYHGTRLDVEHICEVMERLVGQAEERFGIDRRDIAPHTVFVSHETYTPARGGSASAEIHALRRTFGDRANQVVIANTKGYTGHAMGVGIEDVLAIKSLETGIVPPVANIDSDFQPDPELGDLNLSRGGHYPVLYALRLGAGFGSQIAMTLMRRIPGTGERLVNRQTYDRWLAAMAGYEQAELEVEQRTLRIRDAGPPVLLPARSTWQYGQGPTAWALAPDGAPAIQPHSAGIPRPMAAPVPQPAPAAPVAAKTAAPPTAAPAPATAATPQPVASPAPLAAASPLPGPEGTPERELVGGQDPIIGRVLAIVSEKTGYPPDMLDVELDVEADLGIDTVKQAEIFSAIREAYDIPRRDDLSLRDYNTLTKVIGFVRESRPDLAVASTASAALSPAPAPDVPAPLPTGGQDSVAQRVLAIVSEKTGYPPDMLDLELDVEADLGIDTVKQAEIFSAIREAYDIPRRDDLSLRDYNTLTKVIGFVHEARPDLAASAPTPLPAAASTAPAALSPAPAPDVAAPLPTGGQDSVAQRVLAIVSEKTGYPPDMLDLELDVEADLGIDTVKQAEIFSAIREAYDIPRRDDLSLRDYNTLTKVIGFVHEARPDLAAAVSGQTSEAVSQPAEEETVARQSSTDAAPAPSLSAEEPATEPDPVAGLEATYVIPRRVPVPVLRPDLGVCKTTGVSFGPETRVVVVSDSGSAAKYLGYRLRARKTKALILKEATPETAETQIAEWLAEGQIDGVYMLSSLDVEPTLDEMDLDQWRAEQDKRVKTLYTIMRALPNNAFLISATRLGGFHGYTPQGASAPLGGAVTGFTKAYSRERPEALTKALDFDEVDDRQIAELLVNETLSDPGAVEIGYHNGLRFGIGLSEQPVDHLEPTFTIDRDTVFVITGAAGGITAAIVADLARASAGTFYLTDIAPAPDPDNPDLARLGTDDKFLKRDIARRIMDSGTRPTPVMVERELAALERSACIVNAMNTIARAGGTAHYRMCDVTHAQAVQALIDEAQQAHGHIDIVVHAAGMERSHFLPDKPPREFNLIFDVKADGLFNLLKATQALEHPLQAIVVFSSIAGRFGNAGQTDYSAANDLMCKVISSLRTTRPDTRGVATDWSAWAQIGMATRRSIPEMMRRAGIDMLEPDTAVPIVRREIVFGTRGEVVVAQALGILLESHDPDGGLDIERASERLKHDFPVAGHITGMDTYRGLTFEVELNPQDEPFLHDHAMDGTPLLPGVMGIEGFAEVASLIASDLGHAGERFVVKSIENVDFNAPLKFYRQEPRKATWRAVVTPDASEADVSGLVAHVTLESVREIAATKTQQHAVHFAGQVRLVPQPTAADEALAADPPSWSGETSIEPEAIYRVYFHGPAFQVLDGVQSGGGRVTGKMRADLPPIMGKTKQTLTLPRLIELCMQTAGVWEIGKTGTLALPTAIERVVLHRPQENGALLYAEIKPRTGPGDEVSFDGRVVDDQGNLYLELTGYRTARLPDSVADEEVAPLRAAVEE